MSLEEQRLEHQINELVRSDNGCTVHFDYKNEVPEKDQDIYKGVGLVASTYNPNHDSSFMLWTGSGTSKIDALEQLLIYLKKEIPPKTYLNYKIVWRKHGSNDDHESYFVGKTALEVVQKFFHDKNNHDYVIFSMALTPMS